MKRTRQTFLKFTSENQPLRGNSDDDDDSDSDKDKDYIPTVEKGNSDSEMEIAEDKPSTSKKKSKPSTSKKKTKQLKSDHLGLVSAPDSNKQDQISDGKENEAGPSGTVFLHSKYSQHFRFSLTSNNEKVATCMLCEKVNVTLKIKTKLSNTTGLKYHLKTKYPNDHALLFPSEKRPTLPNDQSRLDVVFKTRKVSRH